MFKQRCFRLLLLASAIATSLSAAAYSFESAGIYYNITGNNTVEVTYSDRDYNTYSGSISVPETVTNNGTEYSVTTIGVSAFKGSAVTSVSMPESITSIDYDAFYECENLESVTLPESLTTLGSDAFYFCKSLKAVKIPSGVTAILGSCFSECSSLESVIIPEGVTTIGEYAFYSCELLKTIKIPSKVTAIPGSCFCGCSSLESVTIPEGVTTIGEYAFFGCNHKELTLPSTVTMIESGAFVSNNRFQSITCNATTPPSLGENVFGYNAFATVKVPLSSIAAYRQAEGWKNFTNYYGGEVINNGITYWINEKEAMVAAAEATLTEANIPSAVEFGGNQYAVIKINENVFSGNTNLTVVTLPDGLVEIGNYAFSGCQNLESVAFPESLTTLGDYAFSSCKSLKTIKIPSGVTTIPDQCFNGCSSLESVTIPEGVTTIGDRAFYENRLKNLTLPSTITSIGKGAFSCYSSNLQSIVCNTVIPPVLGDNAFGSSVKDIKVPLSSIAAYRQAEGWKNFTNYYGGDVVNNGITYRIDDNSATITAAEATLTEANIPSSVEFEGNQYPVIKINDEVFFGNANLIVVTLPESLTTLGREAFSFCKSLKTIKIPSGVTAIPGRCFYGCSSLESVTIPEGVTAIVGSAFEHCKLNVLTLPESLEAIGRNAFSGNRSLKSVNIPTKVKTIEEHAFSYCGLTDLVIQEGVQTIDNEAFLYNNNLQSIICNAVTPPTLGDNAFDSSIKPDVKVPLASIVAYRQTVGWKNFTNYYGEEVIADGITYWINEKEAVVAAADSSLTEANIPSVVEFEGNQYPVIKINDKVFFGNANLIVVTLPESLTTLGGEAFRGCQSLKIVKIPSKVTAIPDHCFEGCSSLESVTIPDGVTTIGTDAFYKFPVLQT